MPRFSKIFNVGLEQPQLDFVDINPAFDTPLFIDPFAIALKDDHWSQSCHRHIVHFFQTALSHVRSGREADGRALLNGLSEPNETCLGLSRGAPAGRGVSGKQAFDLYNSLAQSQAAKTGLLEELAECDLFVEGIARDKISDITTNIIRRLLIEYTQEQCRLHGVKLDGEYPTGRFWDMENKCWRSDYAPMPVAGERRIILVPKYSVRRGLALDAQEYYSHHIINFIQEEEFRRGSSLVRTLKSGERRPPFKSKLKERFPFSKEFLANFSEEHPEVLKKYKNFYGKIEGAKGVLSNKDFDDSFSETVFARALCEHLRLIEPGTNFADAYHGFMVGVLEFIFWPSLIYPKKEDPINDGRKRIDITYTNAANSGFFFRVHTAHYIASNLVMVECKNYSTDPANPELDQLGMRFSHNRGKLGFLVCRGVKDYNLLLTRCKDAALAGRGFIIPLGDNQIEEYLELIGDGKRDWIDAKLEEVLRFLIS